MFAIASSARGAIIPRIMPAELVPAANTLNFTVGNGSVERLDRLGPAAGPGARGRHHRLGSRGRHGRARATS
jgi:hypothetical protein